MAKAKKKKSTKKASKKKTSKKKPAKKKAAAAAPKKSVQKKATTAKASEVGKKKRKSAGSHTQKGEEKVVKGSVMNETEAEIQYTSAGEAICREVACDNLASTGGYCRLHYIKNWKKIKRKELILKERKLNRYIEELVAKYPDKYIEAIRTDLASDKEFSKVVNDLELNEGIDDFDSDSESIDSLIDNIRRDIEDDSDNF